MISKVSARRAALPAVVVSLAVFTACGGGEKVVALPPPEVSVSQAVEQKVTEYFETTGRTAAIEAVDIRARVPGYIVSVNFEDGANVNAGDVLFQIDPRPYEAAVHQAEGELARWQAQLRKSEADVARNKSLLPKGAASQRELDSSIASKDTADAEIKATQAKLEQAQLDLEWSRITAPISGRISRTTLTVGNLVQLTQAASEPLTSIVKTDPIYLYFDVDERTLLRAQSSRRQSGQAPAEHAKDLKLPVEIGLATEDGFPHRGMLDFLDNKVDPTTGTIPARAVFDNPNGLLTPGLFCRVRVPLAESDGALLVSERAVGTDQDGKFLFVVNDKNVVEYRPVKLGLMSEGLRVIDKGIAPGEWVITNGIQRVRPGITVKPQQVSMAGRGEAGTPAAGEGEKQAASPPA